MAPTPPTTAPPCFFNEENGILSIGSVLSSPHCDLAEIISPTAEDHILECALRFKRTDRDEQLILLSNDVTMKIKAMAEVRLLQTSSSLLHSTTLQKTNEEKFSCCPMKINWHLFLFIDWQGLICETAEDFQENLVNPFSERFLWKESSPRGSTWSCVDDFILGPLKKTAKSGQAAKGLKLILLHNSHYRQICSGSTVS